MESLRILVVDDDNDFAESLVEVLEFKGHRADVAVSGEKALQKFKSEDYDITFMDIRLPGMNGVESFFEIRNIKPDARVVMMTGFSVPQLLDQAVENGAWSILHKPLDMNRLTELLNQISSCGILIADDDADFVESLQEVLESAGYHVAKASDGQQALSIIQSGSMDILILDLRMPVLSGLGTYLQMKKSGSCIPTILVTAYAKEEAETLSILQSLCIEGVLSKPFDPKDLLDAVEKIASGLEEECL